MVYHCVKQAGYKDGDFANKKIRKGISENCKEIMNFAVSYKSIISEFKSILKSGNRDLIFRALLSCGGRCYDRARRVKLLLRFAEVVANCGIEKMTDEATGEEEASCRDAGCESRESYKRVEVPSSEAKYHPQRAAEENKGSDHDDEADDEAKHRA